MLRCISDFPFTIASAFGCVSVQGLNLVPKPAEKIIAFEMLMVNGSWLMVHG